MRYTSGRGKLDQISCFKIMKIAAFDGFDGFLASTYLNPNQAGKEKNDWPL